MSAHDSSKAQTSVARNPIRTEQPPSYDESVVAPAVGSRLEFPPTLRAYGDLSNDGTFYLCRDSKEDRLYAVTIKSTHREVEPLGTSPGVMLRCGPGNDDLIIAAAGEEIKSPGKYIKNGPNSNIVLMPDPMNTRNTGDIKLAFLLRSKISDRGEVATFTFLFNNPTGSDRRFHQFLWRKVRNGEPGFEYGGWELARHPLEERINDLPPQYGSPLMDDRQPLTRLIYSKPVKLGHSKEMFTLKFTDQAVRLNIGGHWARAVIMTAVRIYQLERTGRTTKGGIGIADVFRAFQI